VRKLWEVFRFEFRYQSKRGSTWLYFAVLLGLIFQIATESYIGNARRGGFFFNAPFVIATMTLLASMMSLLVSAALAGNAAARDGQSRMHPLVYTTPVGKTTYLGGLFLAAFALNAMILLAVPIALLVAALMPGVPQDLLGPFRPSAYLGAYFFIALPNAFIATAFGFSLSALSRRAMTAYLGSVFLFFVTMLSWLYLASRLGRWELAKALDPLGISVLRELSMTTTAIQKNAFSIDVASPLFIHRLPWIAVALGVLALMYSRFRFAHHAAGAARSRFARRTVVEEPAPSARMTSVVVPRVTRTFGGATRVRQLFAVTRESLREILLSWGGLAFAALVAILVLTAPGWMQHLGVPLIPTTAMLVSFLAQSQEIIWMIVPLVTVYYAGELIWRERDASLSEIADAAPVPDWIFLAGKFGGLAIALVVLQVLVMGAAMLIQSLQGYHHFEIGLYARVLFGLQLTDYLLFALLAFVVHVIVNHKYVGHMIAIVGYALMTFGAELGVVNNILLYGSSPDWTYTDMRGFEPGFARLVWFKLYWVSWALLLAVLAKLLWVRGKETGLGSRIDLVRRRFTRSTTVVAVAATALILTLGGFIYANTYIENTYRSRDGRMAERAEYERLYGRFESTAQPRLSGTSLRVEIHPQQRTVDIHGTHLLVNASTVAIDSIHVATRSELDMGAMTFDRPATRVLEDDRLGHSIYALDKPLQPGDSLRLTFDVHFEPRGFPERAIEADVVSNGTYLLQQQWLPAIGYQPSRELSGVGDRREVGLPPRAAIRSLYDAGENDAEGQRIAFDAVVGTDDGQTAVAPGALRRTWTERGRRYFHYVTDVPIRNDYAISSAEFAVREAKWNDVVIEVLYHPAHAANVDRMIRSAQASLSYLTEQFGPYPHRQVRLVEEPSNGNSLHAFPINISYREGFSLFDPDRDTRKLDFPFAVVAHEMAHQWWGNQLSPAAVEGSPLLTEVLAWYSAMGVIEKTYGAEHLRSLLSMMRETYLSPRSRAGVPLLRSYDQFVAYRKGPFAMYALREYVGERPVNGALRRLLDKHASGASPLPTSLDLYRELQAVTPDSLRGLLGDLFEGNTYWELSTEQVHAEPAEAGNWRVTLDVKARKVVVDTAGVETAVPMNDVIEVGVYAAESSTPLYLRTHRVHSGQQQIVVVVPKQPTRAGIDPRNLLIDVKPDDNVARATARP